MFNIFTDSLINGLDNECKIAFIIGIGASDLSIIMKAFVKAGKNIGVDKETVTNCIKTSCGDEKLLNEIYSKLVKQFEIN